VGRGERARIRTACRLGARLGRRGTEGEREQCEDGEAHRVRARTVQAPDRAEALQVPSIGKSMPVRRAQPMASA
jgi:hypothetical protein